MIDQRLEQHRSPAVVHRDVAIDRIHALTNPHFSREVDDGVDPLERRRDPIQVAYVRPNELHVVKDRAAADGVAVHLVDEAVEHSHLMAPRQQGLNDMAPNEPGPTGYQHPFTHPPLASSERIR